MNKAAGAPGGKSANSATTGQNATTAQGAQTGQNATRPPKAPGRA